MNALADGHKIEVRKSFLMFKNWFTFREAHSIAIQYMHINYRKLYVIYNELKTETANYTEQI